MTGSEVSTVDTSFPSGIRHLDSFEATVKEGIVFTLRSRRPQSWGDYERILVGGMAIGDRQNGQLQLQRTGPFVPPLTFPKFHMLVTEQMKLAMLDAGFKGVGFQPVVNSYIVRLDWHEWDLNADEPQFYPEGGEPEYYIMNGDHSEELAEQIGTIWEVVLTEDLGSDLYRRPETRRVYVSPRAARWFQGYFTDWIAIRTLE